MGDIFQKGGSLWTMPWQLQAAVIQARLPPSQVSFLRIPLLIVAVLTIGLHSFYGGTEYATDALVQVTGDFAEHNAAPWAIFAGVILWAIMMAASYRLSLRIYKARSF